MFFLQPFSLHDFFVIMNSLDFFSSGCSFCTLSPFISLGLSSCASGDKLTEGYCQKSTDGHTICIKKENIFCRKR